MTAQCLTTVAVMTIGVLGCSSASTPPPRVTAPERNVLLADEIRTVSAGTAYEAVTRLRPEWLRQRGAVSMRNPSGGNLLVYLDGGRFGGVSSLRTIRAELVLGMEHLDGREATTRFGTGHGGGVILIRTR